MIQISLQVATSALILACGTFFVVAIAIGIKSLIKEHWS